MKYGLTEEEIATICCVFKKYPSIKKVFIFGSRATNTFKRGSDIDLALFGGSIDYDTVGKVAYELEEENTIPYFFDVLDFSSIKEEALKENIRKYGKIFYKHNKNMSIEKSEWKEEKLKNTEIGHIPREWNISELKDVVGNIIDYRGKTPQKTTKGIPLVTAKVVKKGRIDFINSEYIAKNNYDAWMTRGIPKPGDVVITTEAPLGEVAQLPNFKIALAQRIIALSGKNGVLDNTYLKYYFISSVGYNQLKSKGTGSVVTGIKQSELKKIKVLIPCFPEQKAIAGVLSCLDDKIELLRKQNETLENTAQTLFKHWFVDFDFPNTDGKPYKSSGGEMVESELGDIPVGWRVGIMSDLAKHVRNSVKPSTNSANFFWHYSLPSFDEGREPIFEQGGNILSSKYAIKGYCFLVSKLNPSTPRIWTITNVKEGSICSTEFQVFKPYRKELFPYLHCVLNFPALSKELSGKASGTSSSHQRVKPEDILNTQVLLPIDGIVILLQNLINPLLDSIDNNKNQIKKLTCLRNTLLPKLMSGKLRVMVS